MFQRVRAFGARLRRVYTFCETVDDLSALLQRVLRNQIHQIDVLRASAKGSDFRAEAPKGSRFWARLRQTPERVHTFNKILLRVRTFGHAFAGTSKGCALLGLTCKGFAPLVKVRKGFALLGTALPNIQKGSHFCADPGQNLERVRTFGEGLQRDRAFGHGRANYSEGVALLDICSKGFALFLIFCLWRKGIAVFEH